MSIERIRPGEHRVRWREGGRQRSKLVGSKAAAERFERQNRERLLLGESDFWTRGTVSFHDFAADWLERRSQDLSRRTESDYAILLDRYLDPAFGDAPLKAITVASVESFRDGALKRGVGRRQLQLALGVLSQILTRAQARGEIQSNPVALVKGPRQTPRQEVRPLPPETVEAIRGWLLANRAYRDAVLVSVLAYAGLRPGEALALHWHHIQGAELRVEGAASLGDLGPTKTGHARTVDLLPSLRQDLAEFELAQGRPSGLIFRGVKRDLWTQTMWQNWWRKSWVPAVKGLRVLPRPRPYDLRHSFASLLIAQGFNVFEVADQLGNGPDVIRKTYGHVFKEFKAGERVPAEERIRAARQARREVANGG